MRSKTLSCLSSPALQHAQLDNAHLGAANAPPASGDGDGVAAPPRGLDVLIRDLAHPGHQWLRLYLATVLRESLRNPLAGVAPEEGEGALRRLLEGALQVDQLFYPRHYSDTEVLAALKDTA